MYCVINNRYEIVRDDEYVEPCSMHHSFIKYYNRDKIIFTKYRTDDEVTMQHLIDICEGIADVMDKAYVGNKTYEYASNHIWVRQNYIFNEVHLTIIKTDDKKDSTGHVTLFFECSIWELRNLYKTLMLIVKNNGSVGIPECDEINEDCFKQIDYYQNKLKKYQDFNPIRTPFKEKLEEMETEYNKVSKQQYGAINAIYEQYEFEKRPIAKVEVNTRQEANEFITKHTVAFERAKCRYKIKKDNERRIQEEWSSHDNGSIGRQYDDYDYFGHMERF